LILVSLGQSPKLLDYESEINCSTERTLEMAKDQPRSTPSTWVKLQSHTEARDLHVILRSLTEASDPAKGFCVSAPVARPPKNAFRNEAELPVSAFELQ